MLSYNNHLSIYMLQCYLILCDGIFCLCYILPVYSFILHFEITIYIYIICPSHICVVSGFCHIIVNVNEATYLSFYFSKCQRLDEILMNPRGKWVIAVVEKI